MDGGALWGVILAGGEGERLRPFVAEDLVAEPPRILLEQPLNRDTAPGILLPVREVLWSDWGEPARTEETVRRIGLTPSWLTGIEPAVRHGDPGPDRIPRAAPRWDSVSPTGGAG